MPQRIKALSKEILQLCDGENHDDVIISLLQAIFLVNESANNGKFSSEVIRLTTELQNQIVNPKMKEFKPSMFLIN